MVLLPQFHTLQNLAVYTHNQFTIPRFSYVSPILEGFVMQAFLLLLLLLSPYVSAFNTGQRLSARSVSDERALYARDPNDWRLFKPAERSLLRKVMDQAMKSLKDNEAKR